MLGVEAGQNQAAVRPEIVRDRRPTGGERPSLRCRRIRPGNHGTDHARTPACSGHHEQVIGLRLIAADLAESGAQPLCTGPAGLVENSLQVCLAQRKAAEAGKRGLLQQQTPNLFPIIHLER